MVRYGLSALDIRGQETIGRRRASKAPEAIRLSLSRALHPQFVSITSDTATRIIVPHARPKSPPRPLDTDKRSEPAGSHATIEQYRRAPIDAHPDIADHASGLANSAHNTTPTAWCCTRSACRDSHAGRNRCIESRRHRQNRVTVRRY